MASGAAKVVNGSKLLSSALLMQAASNNNFTTNGEEEKSFRRWSIYRGFVWVDTTYDTIANCEWNMPKTFDFDDSVGRTHMLTNSL